MSATVLAERAVRICTADPITSQELVRRLVEQLIAEGGLRLGGAAPTDVSYRIRGV